jgi:hypothetical protein
MPVYIETHAITCEEQDTKKQRREKPKKTPRLHWLRVEAVQSH